MLFADSLISAIKSEWPMLVIFCVIIISIRIAHLRANEEKFVFYKEFLSLLFIIYLLLLFRMVTNSNGGKGGINLVPFTQMIQYEFGTKAFMINIVGNIIVFIPFGYFVSAYIKGKKVMQIFLITLLASLTIELVQLGVGRAFDIDDIILNLIGGIGGFLVYIALTAIKKHLPKMFRKDFFYNLLCLVLLVIIAIYIMKVMGFGV